MINENNKNSWCVNALHGMSGNNDGTTKLCCMYESPDAASSHNQQVLGFDHIDEHFNKIEFVKVRQDLSNGIRHKNCNWCWQEEDAGRKSKRMRDNDKYQKYLVKNEPYIGLAYVELNLGNNCNLACRTCGPQISSGWMKEDHETNNKHIAYKVYAANLKRYHQSYSEESSFWEELKHKLPNIKQFDFYGGEPFMSKKMWDLLKTAQEMGVSKDIELHYNTNGTHFPLSAMQAWKDFKSINISFSIDGIADQFEYMRYPAKWSEVESNMDKFLKLGKEFGNINFSWCITLSTSNIYYVPEILDYYYNKYANQSVGMYLNLVHGPKHHNISILPLHIKKEIETKLLSVPKDRVAAWQHIPGVIGFMNNGEHNKHEFKNFLKTTKDSDIYRSQSFSDTFAEYWRIF